MIDSQLSSSIGPWAKWLLAIRPATLSAAVAPVLVGTAAAANERFRLELFVATLTAALLIQIGTNLTNDLFDYQRGADRPDRLGPPRVTQSGLITQTQVRNAAYLAFGAAAAIGLYLVYEGGWPILAIGIACLVAAVAYTGGPWPLGYHSLGEAACFLTFGLAAVIGTYYLQAEEVRLVAIVAALPVGLLVTAILVVNNLRDIETDRNASKVTLAVRLGAKATRLEYVSFVLGPYALLPLLLLADVEAWSLLPWLTLPLALRLSRTVLSGSDGRALNPVLKRTAQLHLAFGSLLAVGLLL